MAGRVGEYSITCALALIQLAISNLLDLLRKILQDFTLGSAQDKRSQSLHETPMNRPTGFSFTRTLKAIPEIVPAAEITWHQEIHERPDVANGILDGRAGKREPLSCMKRRGRLRIL